MKGVEIFFAKILAPFYETHINLESLSYHPAKMLSEKMQQKGCRSLDTRKGSVHESAYCVGEGLPLVSHEPKLRQCIVVAHGMVLGRGEAKSVHTANRLACSMALETLKRDGDIFGTVCDCSKTRSKAGKEKGD